VKIAPAACPVRVPASARGPSLWPNRARGSRSPMRWGRSGRPKSGLWARRRAWAVFWWLHGVGAACGASAPISLRPACRLAAPRRALGLLRPSVLPLFHDERRPWSACGPCRRRSPAGIAPQLPRRAFCGDFDGFSYFSAKSPTSLVGHAGGSSRDSGITQ
jgi:hypothetical protein